MDRRKFAFFITKNIQDVDCFGDSHVDYSPSEILCHLKSDWVTNVDITNSSFLKLDKNSMGDVKRLKIKSCISANLKPNAIKVSGDNIASRSFLILDCEDYLSQNKTKDIPKKIEALGVDYILYPSISDKPENRRYRVFLFTDRDMTSESEYKAIVSYFSNIIGNDLIDSCSEKYRQLMLLPVSFSDRDISKEIIYSITDNYIKVDEILNGTDLLKNISAKTKNLPDPTQGNSVSAAFCRHLDIHDTIKLVNKHLGTIRYERLSDFSNRYTYIGGSSIGGLVVFPFEGNKDYYCFSFHNSDVKANTGYPLNAFDFCKRLLFTNDKGKELKEAEEQMEKFALSIPDVADDFNENNTNMEIKLKTGSIGSLKSVDEVDIIFAVRERLTGTEDYKFDPYIKEWVKWTGKEWISTDNLDVFQNLIIPICYSIRKDIEKAEDKLQFDKSLKKMKTAKACPAIVKMFENPLSFKDNIEDKAIGKIIVQEGIVDLKTGKLTDFDRDVARALPILNISYDESPLDYDYFKNTKFYQMLWRSSGYNQDWINAMQKILGLSLTGTLARKFFLFYDPYGRTAKSTLLSVMKGILGPELTLENKDAFVKIGRIQSNDMNYLKADLEGKRLITIQELESNEAFNESILKAFTGDDEILGRQIRERARRFRPIGNIFMMGNSIPQFTAYKDAFIDRMVTFKFHNPITDDESINNFHEIILKEEKNLIFKWLVEGAIKYYNVGLSIPEESIKLKKEIVEEKDYMKGFCNWIVADVKMGKKSNTKIRRGDLFQKFQMWFNEEGYNERGFTRKKFEHVFLSCLKKNYKDSIPLDVFIKSKSGDEKNLIYTSQGTDFYRYIQWNEEAVD